MQLVFVLVTLVSEERRNHPLVVGGVGFWYVLACIAQTLWSPAFAYEKLPLAAFVMSCILASLATIVYRQYNVVTTMLANQETLKNSDFWLLQFPFEIHLGWIVAAFVLNLNIVVVGTGASANTQVGVAAVSLASVTLLAVSCLVLVKRSLYTIAWVVVWATGWMYNELQNPKHSIADSFSETQISAIAAASVAICGAVGAFTFLHWIYHCILTKSISHRAGEAGEQKSLTGVSKMKSH